MYFLGWWLVTGTQTQRPRIWEGPTPGCLGPHYILGSAARAVRFFAQCFFPGKACPVFSLLLHVTCLMSSHPLKLSPIITLLLPFPLMIVGGCPPPALSPWLIAFCFSLTIGHMPGLPSCHPCYLLTPAWFAAWMQAAWAFLPFRLPAACWFPVLLSHLLHAWGHLPAACSTCPRAVWFRPLKRTDGISPASLWLSNGEVGCKWLCRINGKEEKKKPNQTKQTKKPYRHQIVIKNPE